MVSMGGQLSCFIPCLEALVLRNGGMICRLMVYPRSRMWIMRPLWRGHWSRYGRNARKIQTIVVTLPKGRYEFYPDSAAERVYFISNHDQMNPKKVGLPFEGMKNMVFDGQGSELIFHGRMLPVSLLDSRNCVLKTLV